MKKIKLTNKGKKFFGGLIAVAFVGTVGISNLNNNPDGQEVAYIDEFQTVYADDISDSKGWEVAHVYEDGCMDVQEPIDGEYKFYCESEFK